MNGRKFIPLLVVVGTLLAYHNSFTGPFIFDDVPAITGNPTIRHLMPIGRVLSLQYQGRNTVEGRPLINLSLAISYAFSGSEVWAYHVLNLLVHILAGLTLLGVVRRTLLQPRLRERFAASADGLAIAVAALWVVHPLQTESVTYVVQRAESIMGLFYLLTLYCFIRAAQSPRPLLWYCLCVAACTLGMSSKEVMVSAPLMVVLYDRAFLSGSFSEAWRRRWPMYLALASTWLVLGYLMFMAGSVDKAAINAKSKDVVWWEYLLTQPGVILHYLRLSVWPGPLCFDYDGWPIVKTWANIPPAILPVMVLLGLSCWAVSVNSVWGFVGAWFFLILAPSSSFMPTDSPAYEHRMYLPLAAVVVLGVLGVHTLVSRRFAAVTVLLAIGLGYLTWQRNQDYRSEFVIWNDAVVKRPGNPRAHNNLGKILLDAGKVPEAIGHFEEVIRIRPGHAQAHGNLGSALGRTGKLVEAVEQLDLALRIQPDLADAHYNMGRVLLQMGRSPEAIEHYQQAVRLNPSDAEAHCGLGNALLAAGKIPQAVPHWEQAVRIKPDYVEARNNLGAALAQAGRFQEAIEQLDQVLQMTPKDIEVRCNLANVLLASGKLPEAIKRYEQALQLARATNQPQLATEIESRLQQYRAERH